MKTETSQSLAFFFGLSVFLSFSVARAVDSGSVGCIANSTSAQCLSDAVPLNIVGEEEEPVALSLLQSQFHTFDDSEDEHDRALLSGRRRKSWGGVSKAVKNAKKAAKDAANKAKDAANAVAAAAQQAAEWAEEAKEAAEKQATEAIDALKSVSRFTNLLPSCMKGGDITGCVTDVVDDAVSSIQNKAAALQKGLDNLVTCPEWSTIGDAMKESIKSVKCNKKVTISYPTGLKTSWQPSVQMSSKDICTGVSGLSTSALKGSIQTAFKTCAPGLFNAVAAGVGAANQALSSGCECKADFGVYFGATVSAAAVVSGSIAAGVIVGCDGCNFKFKPWWSWFAGATSNVAADAGLMVGYATTWASFWGQALVQAASGGPNVVAANLGVGISLPTVKIDTSTQTVEKKVCVSGQCITIKKSLDGVPSGIEWKPPQFGTVDFAITGGVSIIPVDVTSGFASCYAID